MARAHRASKIWFAVGGVLVIAAVLWMLVGVPMLVKYPTDLKASPKYSGTFSVYVNPADMSPLATPITSPMTISREIRAIGSESGSSKVVVKETIVQKAGDLMNTTQTNQYVMDRRSLKNVKDPRAYAFTPSNVVDRSGFYRLNLPFNLDTNAVHRIYKNEIGTSYAMRPATGDETTKVEGLTLYNMQAAATNAPITDAWLAELNKQVKLPSEMTLDQMKPQLKAAGFDVDALMSQLVPAMSPEDVATLAGIAAKPIALQYVWSYEGKVGVEKTTGAEVKQGPITEQLGVKPVMADATTLIAILSKYADKVPAAAAAAQSLPALADQSVRLFGFTFEQTPASVKDIASEVKDQRQMILLAQQWLPLGLALLGGVALLVGGFMWPRGRRMAVPAGRPAPTHA